MRLQHDGWAIAFFPYRFARKPDPAASGCRPCAGNNPSILCLYLSGFRVNIVLPTGHMANPNRAGGLLSQARLGAATWLSLAATRPPGWVRGRFCIPSVCCAPWALLRLTLGVIPPRDVAGDRVWYWCLPVTALTLGSGSVLVAAVAWSSGVGFGRAGFAAVGRLLA